MIDRSKVYVAIIYYASNNVTGIFKLERIKKKGQIVGNIIICCILFTSYTFYIFFFLFYSFINLL